MFFHDCFVFIDVKIVLLIPRFVYDICAYVCMRACGGAGGKVLCV